MSSAIESYENVINWIKYFEAEHYNCIDDIEFRLDGIILSMLLPRVREAYEHFAKRRVFKDISDFDYNFTIYLLEHICVFYADPPIEEIDVKREDEDNARENVENGLKKIAQIKTRLEELEGLSASKSFHWYFGEDKMKSQYHRDRLNEGILYFESLLKNEKKRISIPEIKAYRKGYGFAGVVLGLYKILFGDEAPKSTHTAVCGQTPIARAFNVLFNSDEASVILEKAHLESKHKNKNNNIG